MTKYRIKDSTLNKQNNTYQQILQDFAEGFITKLFNDGIVTEVKTEDLVKWFANPDQYHQQLENINQYFYISNGDVFQQFDLAKVLPTLNYKIEVFNKTKSYQKNISSINKMLSKVKYRTLTRDIISQEITSGTIIGIWLGDKKNPYFYIFDNLEYIFPAYRKNGEWVVWLDLEWFTQMKENVRQTIFNNLSPYIDESDYEKYKQDSQNYRYIELPQERTCVLRTHTTKRNQKLGVPWATQGLMDINHKKKLKDMEVAIANKIIKAVAILKLGNEKTPNPPRPLKQKVVAGVKSALTYNENSSNGTPVIAIPEWCELEFNNTKADALDPKKFETINSDINSSLGTSGNMKSGEGGTYASGQINFEVFFRKIAILLEEIEEQVWQKFLNLILPNSVADDYQIIFDKEAPLSLKDKIDILFKLQNQGFSTKAIIDCISGLDWTNYLEQSLYEIETDKVREKIIPPKTSSTLSSKDNGRPEESDGGSEGNKTNKTYDGNNQPDT